ncbi:hypothetical protein [Actinomadura madurae]|uniref:hypothetical protein n=1 Tax=Actinomadura madurae TaxID=1993 RepID=UPI000D9E3D4D|nr:hypothetical protein [Actinomadura madurae]SPT57083.1 Uncharacterised protein [Actinomadura madurae]
MLERLVTEDAKVAYSTLVTAAFFEAVDRRFKVDGKVVEESEVINFVAYQREIHPDSADLLDPTVAENIILHALEKSPLRDIDGETLYRAQVLLLAALVGEADMDANELDSFLASARNEADAHL